MKKGFGIIIVSFMISVMMLSLVGCGNGEKGGKTSKSEKDQKISKEKLNEMKEKIIGTWHTTSYQLISIESGNILYEQNVEDLYGVGTENVNTNMTFYDDGTGLLSDLLEFRYEFNENGECVLTFEKNDYTAGNPYFAKPRILQVKFTDKDMVYTEEITDENEYKAFDIGDENKITEPVINRGVRSRGTSEEERDRQWWGM